MFFFSPAQLSEDLWALCSDQPGQTFPRVIEELPFCSLSC